MNIIPVNEMPESLTLSFFGGAMPLRRARFDVSAWKEEYPEADFTVCLKKPDADAPYFGNCHMEGDILFWIPSKDDLWDGNGTGTLEVWAVAPGSTAADEPMRRSAAVETVVKPIPVPQTEQRVAELEKAMNVLIGGETE